jgi:hypothetical protein
VCSKIDIGPTLLFTLVHIHMIISGNNKIFNLFTNEINIVSYIFKYFKLYSYFHDFFSSLIYFSNIYKIYLKSNKQIYWFAFISFL